MFMQGLILCQRYADAQNACLPLLTGVDRLYLQAEASWRGGHAEEAHTSLEAALALAQDSLKCLNLRRLVARLLQHERAAAAAREEGATSGCVTLFTMLQIDEIQKSTGESEEAHCVTLTQPKLQFAGRLEECIGECTAALQTTEHFSCAGLHCHLLYHRGSAHAAAGHSQEALGDCSAALQLNPAHAECLHLRHTVCSSHFSSGPQA